jgi:hypothetical protein
MSISEARQFAVRYHNIFFFVGGFIFDALTLRRIDSILDLVLQFGYLLVIVLIVFYGTKEKYELWKPSERISKLWRFHVEALHFIYGSLLSAYVIFYLKSSTFSRTAFFLALVIVLMFANEMPQLRKAGSKMRIGLFALCVVSYLNYLLPVIIGRMGGWVFGLAVALSIWATYALVKRLAAMEPEPKRAYWTLSWSPVVVLSLVVIFYVNKWIPPVPLSMQYAGIYHDIQRSGDGYLLRYPSWPWYQFWRSESRPFLARSGDTIYCFVRVFGPRRFRDQVYLHWQYSPEGSKKFHTSDRIPLAIYGGRGEGFRGYAVKTNYSSGRWRVDVETSDGRPLGNVVFEVREDTRQEEREWSARKM